jgi:hypothetical protein
MLVSCKRDAPSLSKHTILFLPLPPGRPASYAPYSLHIKRDHRPAIFLRDPTLGRPYILRL